MTKVKFTKFGANSAFGGFAPGDVMTCSDTMAQHLVDSDVAEFASTPAAKVAPVVQSEPETQPEKPAKAAKGKK